MRASKFLPAISVAFLGGGFIVVADGEVLAEVLLPVYGIKSNAEPLEVLQQIEKMRAASDSLDWVGLGDLDGEPTNAMTAWFLTPAPWP